MLNQIANLKINYNANHFRVEMLNLITGVDWLDEKEFPLFSIFRPRTFHLCV